MFSRIKKIVLSKTVLIVLSLVVSGGMMAGAFMYRANSANGYCVGPTGLYCFGGKIKSVKVCCNGLKIEVGDPRDGKFMFQWVGSKLYMWWNLSKGKCVLGDAYPFGVCLKIATWPPCTRTETVDGTIRQIGTTLKDPEQGTCGGNGGGGGGGGGGQ